MSLFKRIFTASTLRVPQIGDLVWWAPKRIGGVVTARAPDGTITFQGGEIITNRKGREVPRWTVMAQVKTYLWDDKIDMWIVGRGPTPRVVRGTIITPEPVAMSGKAKGSFAVEG